MATNSTVVVLPPDTVVFVHAISHADMEQRVQIDPPEGVAGGSAVFIGAGENVIMRLEPSGFITVKEGGWAHFTTPKSDRPEEWHEYTVTIGDENCRLHTAPYEAEAGPKDHRSRYATLMVVSEDLIDRDFNDSVLLFSYFISPGD